VRLGATQDACRLAQHSVLRFYSRLAFDAPLTPKGVKGALNVEPGRDTGSAV
jgi:hypothetical protein